jgi:hypothetical protein
MVDVDDALVVSQGNRVVDDMQRGEASLGVRSAASIVSYCKRGRRLEQK